MKRIAVSTPLNTSEIAVRLIFSIRTEFQDTQRQKGTTLLTGSQIEKFEIQKSRFDSPIIHRTQSIPRLNQQYEDNLDFSSGRGHKLDKLKQIVGVNQRLRCSVNASVANRMKKNVFGDPSKNSLTCYTLRGRDAVQNIPKTFTQGEKRFHKSMSIENIGKEKSKHSKLEVEKSFEKSKNHLIYKKTLTCFLNG